MAEEKKINETQEEIKEENASEENLDEKAKAEGDKKEEEAKEEAKEESEEASLDKKSKGKLFGKKEEPKEDEALQTKYLRLMADFQNMKKRNEKEKADIYAFANEKIVKELLNVIDNFERALAVETKDESLKEGMALILKQLNDVLTKNGVTEIKALGEDFDPNFHNAVMMEDTDEFESGKVSAVLQKGYILNSRVVRPSMVKVAN